MPFAPGQPKPARSGRRKGSGNRATVAAILDRNDCDPIDELIALARDKDTKTETKARIYSELAQYRWPKLRAIEHSGPGGGPIETHDVSAAELLSRRIDQLASRVEAGEGAEGTDPDPS